MIAAAIVQGLGVAGQFASGILSANARKAEFAEQIRATRMKMAQTVGTINARASAGGFELGSASTKDYLRATTNEFYREIDALKAAQRRTWQSNILGSLAGLVGGAANVAGAYAKMNPSGPNSFNAGYSAPASDFMPGGAYEGWT